MKKKESNSVDEKKKQFDGYARYSGLAFQMLFIILGGVYGGIKLDEKMQNDFPVFTLTFSTIAFILSIYLSIKDLIKKK